MTEARGDARVSADGELVLLADQDRSRWDAKLLAEGVSRATAALERGHGRFARALARRGAEVVGIDISAALIAKARAAENAAPLGPKAADPTSWRSYVEWLARQRTVPPVGPPVGRVPGAEGEHRDGLGAAHGIDLVDP